MYDAENHRYSTVEVSSSILAVFPMEEPRYIVYTVLHRPKSEVHWGGVICSYLLNDFISSFSGYLDIYPPAFSVEANKILKDNTVNCYKRIASLPAQLPDLRGISAGDACDILSEVNVHVYSFGTGKIYRQEPPPGTTLENDATVKLYLKEN
jgi:cell division protein FtsI (penicillin-binding protein 3)